MKDLATEKTMTIKEIADILGKDESTIRKIGKELFPELFQNGKTTFLNETHVTAIKLNLGKNSDLPKTELEKELLIFQAMQFQQEKISKLQTENGELKPKAIQYDAFLNNESYQRIGDVAKIFGIKPHKLFKMLRDAKILKDNYVPYEPYEHHFKTVETPIKGGFNVFTSYVKPSGVDYISKRFNLQRSA